MRNAECILYFFYKNFVFTFLQFIFGFYCNFTGQTIIDDWFITLFNLLFTSLPVGARALLDHDVKPDDSNVVYLMLPFLYLENRENQIFTIKHFFITLIRGTFHSLINFFWVIYMTEESINEEGRMGDLWFCSVNLFTNILIIVSVDLLIYTKYHTWINFAIIFVITFVSYIIFLILVERMSMFNSVGTIKEAFLSARLWMNIIFVAGTCGIIDFFILGFKFIYHPSSAKELQILLNKNIDMDNLNINELPSKIREKMEYYNEFEGEDDNLKKEITRRNEFVNEQLKLKSKNGRSQDSYVNLNNMENGISTNENNYKNNENKYINNKLIKKRNNFPEIDQTPNFL
jgi:magnesium-transporting ATPase (P-type)